MKRSFKVKLKVFFISFKGLLFKQIKQIFGGGDSTTLLSIIWTFLLPTPSTSKTSPKNVLKVQDFLLNEQHDDGNNMHDHDHE